MPRSPLIVRNLDKAAQDGFKLVDDRGNPLNVPINSLPPTGIYRTSVASNNPTNVMVKVKSKQGDVYPMGFTPEEAFYMRGTQSINPKTGMNVEMGDVQTGVGLKNNSGVNKIARTDISWSPENASPLDGKPGNNQFFLTKQSLPDTKNTYGGNVSQGFTNPFLYVTHKDRLNDTPGLTGLPKELGDHPNNIKPNFNKKNTIKSDPNKIIKEKAEIAKDFTYRQIGTSEQEYTFLHNLDRQIPVGGSSNAYLASYIQTSKINGVTDNEDPTMLGYDLKIRFNSSPLFNGSIISFINQFTDNAEIEERRDIWITFCNQFFKFFKVDMRGELKNYNLETYNRNYPDKIPAQSDEQKDVGKQTGNYTAPRSGEPSDPNHPKTLSNVTVTSSYQNRNIDGVKTYYLKKISGLENLVEKNVSSNSDTVKSMIDYGKDIIKLSLYEDVTINTGYLAMLYKSLSWSRVNGKQLIPENLLRFDIDITITEIRNYNRVFKAVSNNNSFGDLNVYADKLSKYTYTLYDCQFMFNEMSHASEIDMSDKKFTDDFDISFNYKYSNLSFDKFILGVTQSMYKYSIDNSREDVSASNESTAVKNSKTGNVDIVQNRKPISLKNYDKYPDHNVRSSSNTEVDAMNTQYEKTSEENYRNKWENFISSEEPTLEVAKRNDMNKKLLGNLGDKLQRAAIGEVNRQITKQARLLNKTIDNIRNSIGVGRMSAPTNVYDNPKYAELMNDTKNAFRDFVGQSVRGFFGP